MNPMKVMTKKRIPNFEVIRVLAMYFIVIWHFIRHGLLYETPPTYSFSIRGFLDYSLMQIIMIITVMAVNLYVLITGYFMILSKPKWEKIPHLWFQVFIYSMILWGVKMISENANIDIKDLVHNSLVIRYNAYWFVTKYLALILLAPFINICIQNINRRRYSLLLIVMFFMDVTLIRFFYGEIYSGGQSLFHFVYLYLIAGYLRIYNPFGELKSKKIGFTLVCFFIAIFLMETSIECLKCIYHHECLNFHLTLELIGNNEFTLFTSVLFFVWMSKLNFNTDSIWVRMCMKIAPMTFAVYLITDNNYVRPILWKWILENSTLNSGFLYIELLFYSFGIFVACIIIDYFLKRFMSCFYLDALIEIFFNKVKNKIDKYLVWK